MAAISKVIRLSQKPIGAEPLMSTLCICFVGRRFQKTHWRMHNDIVFVILETIVKIAVIV